MTDPKADVSDPNWIEWFSKKMEEASPREKAFWKKMRRVAKVRDEILASVPMVDQDEACILLSLSETDPSATLFHHEVDCQILRFNIEGQAAYPLFQFDVTRQRVHPTLIKLMEMRPDAWGGQMTFLHWLTRPNRSLGNARPCDRLEKDADAIVASFKAEISQPLHG